MHGQEFGEKFDAGFVGAAMDGRGREGDLQGVAKFAGDGVLPGAGANADGEGHAVRRLMNPDHFKVVPSIVCPVKVGPGGDGGELAGSVVSKISA